MPRRGWRAYQLGRATVRPAFQPWATDRISARGEGVGGPTLPAVHMIMHEIRSIRSHLYRG